MYKNVPENKQDAFHNRVKLAQAPLSAYRCPTTADEYWLVVDNYWSYLLGIIERFAPRAVELDGEILSIVVAATRLKEDRDIRLVEYFNKTWASAPDCGTIHLIPGWPILCDLCSESCLIYEEETEA